jgi:hypothetical protein
LKLGFVGVPAAVTIAGVVAFFVAQEPAAVQVAADAEPEMSLGDRVAHFQQDARTALLLAGSCPSEYAPGAQPNRWRNFRAK